jgi:hypothetical protein
LPSLTFGCSSALALAPGPVRAVSEAKKGPVSGARGRILERRIDVSGRKSRAEAARRSRGGLKNRFRKTGGRLLLRGAGVKKIGFISGDRGREPYKIAGMHALNPGDGPQKGRTTMRQIAILLVGAAAFLAATAGTRPAQGVTDKQVIRSTTAARAWLLGQDSGGVWPQEEPDRQGGRSCLALLTLVTLGEDPESPLMAAALDVAMRQPTDKTYVRAVRAMALAAIQRKLDKAKSPKYAVVRLALMADCQWLVNAQGKDGGWDYRARRDTDKRYDFSNTQMAILALWQASLAGIEIPDAVWLRSQRLYYTRQLDDGSWNYGADDRRQPGLRFHHHRHAGPGQRLPLPQWPVGQAAGGTGKSDQEGPRLAQPGIQGL